MPFPSDEKLMALSRDVLAAFDALFGVHPGFRAAHAKGLLVTGSFTPSTEAAKLSRAQHFNQPSTQVFARFSNSTGVPMIPDGDPNANPRGLALRFQLAEHVHTDIVAHSANGFPARNGQEFLEFLRAVKDSAGATESPSPIEKFLGSHPASLAFVQLPKPAPSSFAREAYFGLTAMCFHNTDGAQQFGRYRILPDAGLEHLDDATVSSKGPGFLFDELEQRIAKEKVGFGLYAQLANVGDVVDDVSIQWPEDRPLVKLGQIDLHALSADNASQQKTIIFDPIPRLDGIEPSADPLLELRAAIYLLSGKRRREA